jgi:hypothetical protein
VGLSLRLHLSRMLTSRSKSGNDKETGLTAQEPLAILCVYTFVHLSPVYFAIVSSARSQYTPSGWNLRRRAAPEVLVQLLLRVYRNP